MKIKPRHFTALQCGILATFLTAIWLVMLTPFEQASAQLAYMFEDDSTRTFSFSLAAATIGAIILTGIFCLKQSESKKMSGILAFFCIAFLALAIWQFSQSLIFGFGTTTLCALWTWKSSNSQMSSK